PSPPDGQKVSANPSALDRRQHHGRVTYRAPNTNAYERFVQTIQQECPDKFIAFGPAHMDHLVREYVEHYHTERPHQGKGNAPLTGPPSSPVEGEVVCRERLGGVLRHYFRVAA